jgi:hypothetical protein
MGNLNEIQVTLRSKAVAKQIVIPVHASDRKRKCPEWRCCTLRRAQPVTIIFAATQKSWKLNPYI